MTRRLLVAVGVLLLAACGQGGFEPDLAPELSAGNETYSSTCATCHGGNGEGGAAPALDGVLETFGSCPDQIEWITLGSERWKTEVGATYGDTGKEITAVMPEFSRSLTDDEIARVAAYERHRFGRLGEQEALADCGLS